MINIAFSCRFITTKARSKPSSMFRSDQAHIFRRESSLMSITRDHGAAFWSLLNETHPDTHLHKEEAGHDVGAGLLLAAVIGKAPHRPPLCRQLTVNHLWGVKGHCKALVYFVLFASKGYGGCGANGQ